MLFRNLWGKVANERLPLAQKIHNFSSGIFFLLLLFLPTQLGFHFWPQFSYVSGQRVDYLSPTLYVTDALIILLFISQIFPRKIGMQGKQFVLLGGILGYLGMGVWFSISPFAGAYGLVKLVEMIFLGWFVAQNSRQTIQFLCITFPLGILVESILAIWQFILQHSIGGWWYFLGERNFAASTPGIANVSLGGSLVLRPYATFSHPNVLAGFLLVGLAFVGLFLARQAKWQKKVSVISFVLGTVALLITLSRTAIVLASILCALFFAKWITRQTKQVSIISVFLGLAGFGVLMSVLLPRFEGTNLFGESILLRAQLMQASWQMFVARPFFGVGIQNFLPNLPLVASSLALQPVHNIYLLILSETGSVGFVIFGILIFKTLRRVWNATLESHLRENTRMFVGISFFIFLFVGLVDHYFLTLQQGQLLTAVVFGLAWGREGK